MNKKIKFSGITALTVLLFSFTFPGIGLAQIPEANDRIGWSADGNMNDPDDWGASAMALAIFAKAGWQDRLVHIDYNNWLAGNKDYKSAEETISMLEGAKRFGFTKTRMFDNQSDLEAAVASAVAEINKSSEDSKFWYVQAGPFEVAYQALKKADPAKRKYCILVSHSPMNEKANKWPDQHGKEDCMALGASYYFTTGQGKDKFGSGSFMEWQLVDWMKDSPCADYQWVYSRMKKTAEYKDGVLDASDGGMAYVLVTGDTEGNFSPKLRDFLGSDWKESSNGSLEKDRASEEWTPLFNGKSLEGWNVACVETDKDKNFWRVSDGTIECYSLGNKDHDYVWLCTDKEYDDFELKLKFKVFRENKGNSGVQVRSRYDRSPNAQRGGWLDGPQFDIHPNGPWRTGLVYDETREERGWIYPKVKMSDIGPEHGPEKVVFKFEDEGDGWNEMYLVCDGTRLKSVVNGNVVCDEDFSGILDSDVHKKYNVGMNGHIALQIHAKTEVKIQFKDIEILELW